MGSPAAKQNDQILATDTHVVLIPPYQTPTPLPHPFTGMLDSALSSDVSIEGSPAATVSSQASNTPPHIPQGGPFQTPPSDTGTIQVGSSTVFINGQPAARAGDTAMTCNDPADAPMGTVVSAGTVFHG
jgi:uncharacterized Zn-binding protein involved in type VI secretion